MWHVVWSIILKDLFTSENKEVIALLEPALIIGVVLREAGY